MEYRVVRDTNSTYVFGCHNGEEQIIFQCAKELEDTDLRNYVNKERIFLDITPDLDITDLHNVPGKRFLGYYRMYFSNGMWYGRWLDVADGVEEIDVIGIEQITEWIRKSFTGGCDYYMEDYLSNFPIWGTENRYLLKPLYSDVFKIMVDTTYGNGDYPVRIYVYEENKGNAEHDTAVQDIFL